MSTAERTAERHKQIMRGWHGRKQQSADDDGELVAYFGPINAQRIDPAVETAIDTATLLACADLGIERPDVVLFAKCLYGAAWQRKHLPDVATFECASMRGIACCDQKLVGICVDLSPADAAETAAHELRHVWQGNPWSEQKELDAVRYGERIRAIAAEHCEGVPQVHHLESEPGSRQAWLAGEVERGDLLIADDSQVAFLNVGTAASPDW